ncbi:MAG: hypothetical protein LIP06_09120 [Tannerellaceae bacterium]|nr:hypothetical protein [Tannerellaceae bacterium]
MEKKYNFETPVPSKIEEPATPYGTDEITNQLPFYDIPPDYLRECIEQGKKDIAAGNVFTTEEVLSKILGCKQGLRLKPSTTLKIFTTFTTPIIRFMLKR